MFVNFFSETLQAEGNSRIPTIFIISSNVLNIILDPIFIFNLNLGVKGTSYATVLSSLIPFIVFVFLYLSGRTKFHYLENTLNSACIYLLKFSKSHFLISWMMDYGRSHHHLLMAY